MKWIKRNERTQKRDNNPQNLPVAEYSPRMDQQVVVLVVVVAVVAMFRGKHFGFVDIQMIV